MFFEICNGINYQPQLVIPCKFNGWNFAIPKRKPDRLPLPSFSRGELFFRLGCMILEIQIASSQCPEVKLPRGSLVHITSSNEKCIGPLGYIKGSYNPVFNGDCKNTFINLYQPEQCYFFLGCWSSEVHMFFSVSVSSRSVEHVPVKTLLYYWIGWALEIPGSKTDKRQVLLKSEFLPKSLPWPENQNLFLVGHSPLGWGRSIRFFQASFAMMSWQELGNAKVLMPEKTIPWGVTHFLGAMGVFLLKHSTSRFTIDISSTMVKVSWDSR